MNNVIRRSWRQGKMVQIEDLRGMAFQEEEAAHTFQISGVNASGETVPLSGSVGAIFLRADNTDVAITGTVTDGVASITLPEECYDMPGRFGLTVYLTSEGQKVAIYAAIGSVSRTSSGNVSPGTSESVADLIDAINAAIQDLEEAIEDIPEDYSDLEYDVDNLKSAVHEVTENVGTSRNIFDTDSLSEKTGITYENGVFTGAASSFGGTYMEGDFESGKQYTIQLKAQKTGDPASTNGLVVKLKYTDNTAAVITIPNSTTEYTKFTATSAEGKNVSSLFFEYVSGGSNIWNLKEIQIEEGTQATDYVPPELGELTAVDTVARAMATAIEEISETVEGLTDDIDDIGESVESIESDLSDITERNTSKNIFDKTSLSEKTGITYENGVFTGAASSFGGTYMEGDFESGKQYTIQLKAQKTGDPASTNGLVVKLKYTDNTAAVITIPNSTTEYTKFTATSAEGKNVSSLFFEYVSGGSNIWNLKEIQIEQGTEATDYVEPARGELTAVDDVARAALAKVDELTEELDDLADAMQDVSDSVSEMETDVSAITEEIPSRNVFDPASLSQKTGITYENGVFTGAASSFSGTYMEGDFESGKQYTIQFKAKKEGTAASTNGLVVKLKHSDNTAVAITILNSTTEYTEFTATSAEGKTVSCVVIEYVSGGSNVWDLKEIQIEEGTQATEYVPPVPDVTAVDSVARATASENKHDPWHYRFGSDYLRIAYSSMHIDPINTATHWLVSSDMGFNVLKGDVEITSDGKLVMCHDAGFTFDSNGRITTYDVSNNTKIVEMTYAECRSKEYAILPQRYGDYCPVADIDDFLHICKDKGKICFVTIRDTNTEDVVEELADRIHFYGMENSTIINALSTNLLEVVRENPKCDDIAINYIATQGYAITTANVDSCVSLGKCFLSIWCNDTKSIIDNSAAAIAYADEKGVPLLAGCITSMDTWNYLISKGIRGSQISEPIFDFEPKEQRVNISVSNGAASFWHVFGGDRYTGNATLSGTTLTVSDVCIKGSLLQNVIDGIQPIKMNLFHPVIRCFDGDGNSIPCVWSNNAFVLTLNNANDNIYSIIVDV